MLDVLIIYNIIKHSRNTLPWWKTNTSARLFYTHVSGILYTFINNTQPASWIQTTGLFTFFSVLLKTLLPVYFPPTIDSRISGHFCVYVEPVLSKYAVLGRTVAEVSKGLPAFLHKRKSRKRLLDIGEQQTGNAPLRNAGNTARIYITSLLKDRITKFLGFFH